MSMTEKEREVFEMVCDGVAVREISRRLNVSRQAIKCRLDAARRKGYVPGVPYQMAVGEGMELRRYTAQQDKDGNIIQTWAKPVAAADFLERATDVLIERAKAKATKIAKPRQTGRGIIEMIIADPHAGMYAWAKETGDDYDLDIFRSLHVKAVSSLLGKVSGADYGVLAVLGDLFHADNKLGVTDKSRNVLDVDGRFGKMVDAVVDTIRDCILMMAGVVKRLDVVVVPGNHDKCGTVFFQRILDAYFSATKHITVHVFEPCRHYVRIGRNLFGYYHGDRIKAERLQTLMSQERPEEWGMTTNRHWRCGHIHQSKRFAPAWDCAEAPGVDVEYFRVLAGLEAYAAEAGYSARRSMSMIVHDNVYGEIERYSVTPEMMK